MGDSGKSIYISPVAGVILAQNWVPFAREQAGHDINICIYIYISGSNIFFRKVFHVIQIYIYIYIFFNTLHLI